MISSGLLSVRKSKILNVENFVQLKSLYFLKKRGATSVKEPARTRVQQERVSTHSGSAAPRGGEHSATKLPVSQPLQCCHGCSVTPHPHVLSVLHTFYFRKLLYLLVIYIGDRCMMTSENTPLSECLANYFSIMITSPKLRGHPGRKLCSSLWSNLGKSLV